MLTLCVNGEIYNHGELRGQLEGQYTFQTQSDCEVVLPLYATRDTSPKSDQSVHTAWINKLRGMFAFVLHDAKTGE